MGNIKRVFKFLQKNKKYAVLLILFLIFYVVLLVVFRKYQVSQDEIRKVVEPYGWYGLFVLFGVQIIFSLTPMPDAVMPLLAYVLYGPVGILVIMAGMFVAAVIHYFIGKKLGKEFIIKKFPAVSKLLTKLNNGNTIIKLIYMRLFTLVSFDITSYIAGISDIPFRTFAIATVLGLIPTNLTLMLISSGLFANSPKDFTLIWVAIIITISLLAYWYKHSTIESD